MAAGLRFLFSCQLSVGHSPQLIEAVHIPCHVVFSNTKPVMAHQTFSCFESLTPLPLTSGYRWKGLLWPHSHEWSIFLNFFVRKFYVYLIVSMFPKTLYFIFLIIITCYKENVMTFSTKVHMEISKLSLVYPTVHVWKGLVGTLNGSRKDCSSNWNSERA